MKKIGRRILEIHQCRPYSHVQRLANDNAKTHFLLFLMLQSKTPETKIYSLFINVKDNRAPHFGLNEDPPKNII